MATESRTAYWFCRENMTSPNAPRTTWREGQTRTLRGGEIVPCQRGYHGSPTPWDALQYATGPMLCIVELSGDVIAHGSPVDKYAARTRTLVRAVNIDRLLREFAIECAAGALPIFEATYPADARPRLAIEAARGYLAGRVTLEELHAAGDAAQRDSFNRRCYQELTA